MMAARRYVSSRRDAAAPYQDRGLKVFNYAASVALWLGDNPGQWRASQIKAGVGQDDLYEALRLAERRGWARCVRRRDMGCLMWQAGRREVIFVVQPLDGAENARTLTGAMQRGGKLALWLAAHPGWHAEGAIARQFLFSRFDLIDALEAAEALELVESRPGDFGKREWCARAMGIEAKVKELGR